MNFEDLVESIQEVLERHKDPTAAFISDLEEVIAEAKTGVQELIDDNWIVQVRPKNGQLHVQASYAGAPYVTTDVVVDSNVLSSVGQSIAEGGAEVVKSLYGSPTLYLLVDKTGEETIEVAGAEVNVGSLFE